MELLFEGRSDLRDFRGSVRFVQHRPTVLPEPVVLPDTFADRNGATVYGTVLRDGGMFRMWYQAMPEDWDWKVDMSSVAYAESDDGIHWKKPNLNLVKHGTEANNFVNLGLHCPSVFIDPDSPPSHRYRATGCGYKELFMKNPAITDMGYYTAHSRDGLYWELDAPRPRWPFMDVISSIYHPGRRGAMVAMKRGATMGGIIRRVLWSADFRNGEYGDAVSALIPDEFDDIAAKTRGCVSADYYGMGMMPAGRGTLGFLWPFWHQLPYAANLGLFGFSDITLVYQQDPGGRWLHFPGRPNFIDHGTFPWMRGWINTASTTIEVGDEQWLYLGGVPYSHGFYTNDKWETQEKWIRYTVEHGVGGIGIAKWPKYRLVGYEANPEGSFVIDLGVVSQPSEFLLNYTTRAGGSVRVEMDDGQGTPVSTVLTGDAIARAVAWKPKAIIQSGGHALTARIHLECATAYAFDLRPLT